jgi:prepilin-type N-terminal cleavage/methylation domain-containing protein
MLRRPRSAKRGYTLVEILVALTLTLILMTTVVTVFGRVGTGMRNARRALEQNDRLRTAAQQLRSDLNGITARLDGRAGRPEEALGYFELIEGSYLFNLNTTSGGTPYYGVNDKKAADYTVGELGDILMFTSRNAARPFVGRFGMDANGNPQTIQSDVAEVSWYLRGNRLHRRVLLVVPGVAPTSFTGYSQNKSKFYNDYDLSAHISNGQIVPNSLADLVKRQNRFAHDPTTFPYDVRQWGPYGLPTLAECTSQRWMAGSSNGMMPQAPAQSTWPSFKQTDYWDVSATSPFALTASSSANLSDQALTNLKNDGTRVADDVVLTNVIGFDVKVWEPAANGGAGDYLDLGYGTGNQGVTKTLMPGRTNTFQTPANPQTPRFDNWGVFESGLSRSGNNNNPTSKAVYDSGCFSYANELGNSQATNGLADGSSGVVDDMSEYIVNSPGNQLNGKAPGVSPYPVPLRGIQVKIRCFEPDSKQVREVTIEHDFLPK